MAQRPVRIRFRDWTLSCILGVYAHERTAPRLVCIDLVIDVVTAGRDDLAGTVDYDQLRRTITTQVETSTFQLIESLAEQIASIVLNEPRVTAVTVCVGKPGAMPDMRTVEVEITRNRGDRVL